MAVSSLPSPYGIGTLGKAAYDFVDFLKAAGQSYWQMPAPDCSIDGKHGFDQLLFVSTCGAIPPWACLYRELIKPRATDAYICPPSLLVKIPYFLNVTEQIFPLGRNRGITDVFVKPIDGENSGHIHGYAAMLKKVHTSNKEIHFLVDVFWGTAGYHACVHRSDCICKL